MRPWWPSLIALLALLIIVSLWGYGATEVAHPEMTRNRWVMLA